MKLSPRRAEVLALIALGLQLLFFLLMLLVGARTNSLAVKIEAWHFLGGSIIWLILLLQFRQKRLAEEEKLDVEQYQRLRSEGKDISVFEGTSAADSLHIAGRRLAWLEKYLLTVFAFIASGYLLGIGYWLYQVIRAVENPVLATHSVLMESAAFLAGIGLVSFLFSRYAVGMSQLSEWRPLRAGGSYLLSNALACFALTVILLAADAGYLVAERVMSYVLVLLMGGIGIEIIFNLILDAYRPRIKGRYRRAAYESRLLGLFSEPGGILRTTAHAIDYQFGFKVSETWFYKLLERAVVPLLLLQAMALYLLSCLAIVPAGNVGVLERWGRPVNVASPYQSGLHVKLPWPIDAIRTFPVEQVQIIDVGFERKPPRIDEKTGREIHDRTAILWTQEHWKDEFPFLVAVSRRQKTSAEENTPTAGDGPEEDADSGSDFDMLIMGLTVHYRIDDVAKYGYGGNRCYQEPHKLLESICYRQALHYAAQWDIERLMGPGREQTVRALRRAIDAAVAEYELGVKIVFVGLEAVHPPIDVAGAFEDVVSALQQKQALVLMAQGYARQILAEARGNSEVRRFAAQAYRFERAEVTEAATERFGQQNVAYQKGRDVYLSREYLAVLDDMLPEMRKYVIASDNVNKWVYELDLKEKLEPDLFSGLGLETPKESSP